MEIYFDLLEKIKSDPYQSAAYEYEGNAIVKAGPGSGKTTVIIMKIKKILSEKVFYPRGLACITYSNATTNHFSKKLAEIGVFVRKNVVLSTIHSFCLKEIIIPFGDLSNSQISFPLKIMSDETRKIILNKCLKKKNLGTISLNDFDILRSEYHSPIKKHKKVSEEEIEVIIDYENTLLLSGYSDFSLIVSDSLKLINENEYIRKCIEAKFPWILIDEYQDLGQGLHEIVLILSQKTKIKFFIVGDPDQSIYSFQGANPDLFYQLYDNPSFKQFELKRNYRTTQYLIDKTLGALDMDNREYESGVTSDYDSKFFFIECEENMVSQYMYLVNDLIPNLKEKGISLEEVCILLATNNQINELAEVFSENGIPFFIEGSYFLKLNSASWIIKSVNYVNHNSNFKDLYSNWERLSNKRIRDKDAYFKLFKVLKDSRMYQDNLAEWYNFINTSIGFEELLSSSELAIEQKQYEQFKEEVLTKEMSLEEFCNKTSSSNKVTICTRHSSKGLEFEVVALLGMEEGSFPYFLHKEGTKEYREQERVFFVSLTRAKYGCYLLRSKVISGINKYGNNYVHEKNPSVFWEKLYQTTQNLD
ncbi:hypothetical protein BW721_11245 [Jeotgalibaca sp. PTS2502]|uniref:UvrD-helicase domain-containing protein n=1 Tax=Jeotgalibaca sp. PTS2502 TaxID=1903686 RepID=UPI000973AA09|nr:ATP-dependent helicase [Jeotgalibaca sp. PTS2502]APZ50153.1 hypothetical protein BW721_11245 [Jeotgalibaca sp. PTS2502]